MTVLESLSDKWFEPAGTKEDTAELLRLMVLAVSDDGS